MQLRAVVLAFACGMGSSVPLLGVPLRAQDASPRASSEASGVAARGMARVRLTVATHALQRGDTLREADIAVVDTSIVWRWNTLPDTTRAQAGWITRRAIAAGEVLRSPAVGAAPVVKVGTKVSVIYQDGPVRILLTGIATGNAALGAPVGVRIDATRRLDGIAVAANTVRLH